MSYPNARSRQIAVPVQTVARWLAAPAVAIALFGLTACSSPTPNTPGQAPNELSDTVPGDMDGGEAPAMGMPTMIPPGGGEEYFSITVEPTEDLGYPPPPTRTYEEKQLDAYPAPGEATTDDDGGEVDAVEAGDDAEDTGGTDAESGEEAGEGDGGDEGGDGGAGGDEG